MVQPEPNTRDARQATRRLGGRKDRTGCITCKIRRVKCDEGKPACQRCTSTGRKCDGYAQSTLDVRTAKQALISVQPKQLMGSGSPVSSNEEHTAFQFFAGAGVSDIAGCTDITFWTRLMPQYAQLDAAVYHASVAVGFLLLRAGNRQSTCYGHPHRARHLTLLAVERQNRAIQDTVNSIKTQGTIARQPAADAMTLLLLFCIEALQGREEEALRLMQRGIDALCFSDSTAATAGLDAQLDRLRLQCGMFNAGGARAALRVSMRAMARIHARVTAISSLDDARDELSDLIAAVQHTVSGSWKNPCDLQTGQRLTLEMALDNWRMRFEQFVSAVPGWPSAVSSHDADTVCQLRLRERIAHVWLVDSPDGSEMVYDDDKYIHIFADIVDEADRRRLQNKCCTGEASHDQHTAVAATTLPQPLFTFEMGYIPPLYWALLKCRSRELRRQLLTLLRRAPLQEGLWNRQIMMQVAEQVMAYEEAGRGEASISAPNLPSTAREQSPGHQHPRLLPKPALPPESARIKVVQIGLRTTLASGLPGDRVQCFGRPRDIDGPLQLVLAFVATAS